MTVRQTHDTTERGNGRLGILVGGGPAPGINSAISAATIEAINSGVEVVGIYDGYEHLMRGRTDMTRALAISDVSRIHYQGGSVLRTSRANPTSKQEDLQRTLDTLGQLGIRYLVTIGGEDTAFTASQLALRSEGALGVVHIPKTIDNDLPLPGNTPTFGFESARYVGTELMLNLMEDARTTNRWFFVVVMGRKAGHLALGIGKAAGATLTIIPEEFRKERVSVAEVCTVLEGAILKRRVTGNQHGVAIVAEGIGEKLDAEELASIAGGEVERDTYGHVRLADIPLAAILKQEVQKRFGSRGDRVGIVDITLGYEMRCARPIPFDIDYTRTLAYSAVRTLLGDGGPNVSGLVYLEAGRSTILPFDQIQDPATGRTRVRMVDIDSEHYTVSRSYMIRLERRDFDNPDMKAKLAEAARMPPEMFEAQFGPSAGSL